MYQNKSNTCTFVFIFACLTFVLDITVVPVNVSDYYETPSSSEESWGGIWLKLIIYNFDTLFQLFTAIFGESVINRIEFT